MRERKNYSNESCNTCVNANSSLNKAPKRSREDQETAQNLHWTTIPSYLHDEALAAKSREIMELYQSKNATPEDRQHCRDLIVAKYERFIYDLIHKHYESFCPAHVCDFFQYGVIGLLKAMDQNYDPTMNIEFYTYAKGFIYSELANYANNLMYGQTAHYSTIYKKVIHAQNELLAAGLEPDCRAIALSTGLNESAVKNALDFQKRVNFVYIDGMDDPNNLGESYDTPTMAYEKKEQKEGLYKAVNSLPKERSMILKMRFALTTCPEDESFVPDKQMNIREIAEKMDMTASKVKSEIDASIAELRLSEYFRAECEAKSKKVRCTINRMNLGQTSIDELRAEMRLTSQAVAAEIDFEIIGEEKLGNL